MLASTASVTTSAPYSARACSYSATHLCSITAMMADVPGVRALPSILSRSSGKPESRSFAAAHICRFFDVELAPGIAPENGSILNAYQLLFLSLFEFPQGVFGPVFIVERGHYDLNGYIFVHKLFLLFNLMCNLV